MGRDLSLANQLSLVSDDSVELVDSNEVKTLTMSEYKREKDKLAAMRQQVMLRLDARKLAEATKVMDAMDITLDRYMETVMSGTAMDAKFLAEAYEKLNKNLSTLTRLDTVDGTGKAARLALQVDFGGGSSVKAVIESE